MRLKQTNGMPLGLKVLSNLELLNGFKGSVSYDNQNLYIRVHVRKGETAKDIIKRLKE